MQKQCHTQAQQARRRDLPRNQSCGPVIKFSCLSNPACAMLLRQPLKTNTNMNSTKILSKMSKTKAVLNYFITFSSCLKIDKTNLCVRDPELRPKGRVAWRVCEMTSAVLAACVQRSGPVYFLYKGQQGVHPQGLVCTYAAFHIREYDQHPGLTLNTWVSLWTTSHIQRIQYLTGSEW